MNSKERILTTLDHKEPDRVPIDSWLAPEIAEVLINVMNLDLGKDPFALTKALGNDLLYTTVGFCDGFSSIFKEERKISDNLYMDPFGIKWRKKSQKYGSYCEFAEHPFKNIDDYDKYIWPNPMEIYKAEFELYEKLLEEEGKEYAILGGCACTMFEACWYLRGLEEFLTDLYLNRDFAIELLDKTMDISLRISKRLVEMGVDIIWWGDDISNERGPYIDPKLFRELIKPRYLQMVDEVKKINKDIKIAFHSDGAIGWVLNDFADIGFDIINPVQPDVNDVARIKKKYGKRFTFWGDVDTRRVMTKGTFADVAEEVKRCITTLSPGGGHILCTNHTVQASPRAVDNVIAYYYIADKFRDYPINIKPSKKRQKLDVYFT